MIFEDASNLIFNLAKFKSEHDYILYQYFRNQINDNFDVFYFRIKKKAKYKGIEYNINNDNLKKLTFFQELLIKQINYNSFSLVGKRK